MRIRFGLPLALAFSGTLSIPIAVVPTAAAVSLTPLTQTRLVDVAVERQTLICNVFDLLDDQHCDDPLLWTTESFSDSHSAPGLAAFDETAALVAFPPSHATQTSTIGGLALTAVGTARATAGGFATVNLATLNATEVLEEHTAFDDYIVSFTLSESSPYSLDGTLHLESFAAGGFNDNVQLSLVGPGGTVFSHSLFGFVDCEFVNSLCSLDLPVSEVGNLDPGTYTLSATAKVGSAAFVAAGSVVAANHSGRFDVQFDLASAPVPLLSPGGAVVLAACLLAVVAVARRFDGGAGRR